MEREGKAGGKKTEEETEKARENVRIGSVFYSGIIISIQFKLSEKGQSS